MKMVTSQGDWRGDGYESIFASSAECLIGGVWFIITTRVNPHVYSNEGLIQVLIGETDSMSIDVRFEGTLRKGVIMLCNVISAS